MTDEYSIPDWVVVLVGRLCLERELALVQAAQAAQTNGTKKEKVNAPDQ